MGASARIAQAKKDTFLRAYAELGTVLAAAEAVGISTRRHYEWLERSEAYAQAFHDAEERAVQRLEREALRRAVEGVEETQYFQGRPCGTTRRYSDVLLIFLLKAKRPEVYRERLDSRFTANLNVESAVKIIHQYEDQAPAIEVLQQQDSQPNRALMAPVSTTIPAPATVLTEHKVGSGPALEHAPSRIDGTLETIMRVPVTKTSED